MNTGRHLANQYFAFIGPSEFFDPIDDGGPYDKAIEHFI